MAQPQDDLYEVLQVQPWADDDVIADAYRRLVRKYHPDFNPGGGDADRVVRIHRAYAVLRDPARRAAYDRARGAGPAGAGARRRTWPGAEAPVVVIARCFEVGQEIAIRFEHARDGVWRAATVLVWSPEQFQRHGAGPARVVQGSFDIAPSYPGCPFCGARSLLQCPACENLACWDGRTTRAQGRPRQRRQPYGRCPWCRAAIELVGHAIERISGHG